MRTLAAVLALMLVAAPEPTPQLVIPCRVLRVHDGDTLTVEVKWQANVRLLDCWAPELSDAEGPASRDKLQALAAGKTGILTVPLFESVEKSLTFGRILGRLQIDGRDVGEQMVDSGLATTSKER